MVASCVPKGFLTFRCIPVGLDLVLPFAIFATLIRASWTIYHRSTALHGEHVAVALPSGVPHPANFFPFRNYPAGSEVPVWMLVHIADTERDESEEGENAVGLV
ncbi:hypothetical protein DFH08DRAFT_1082553 [Mycena albidolilacea]|uniref:Uncharacterized protein n=1 Tax=Mycena albidolilacea TaxID=1033008 RepID=A0AAD6ZTJ8_9AGAR|nr:hypothetical protein DFH08DRAFT_1082553 [Mycena albidolilacea]